jgi:hypothetical protein
MTLSPEEIKYINVMNPLPANTCISMPRSGSTLLMRLMAAHGSPVTGDVTREFYQSILGVFNHFDTHAIYGSMKQLEANGVFMDSYRGDQQKACDMITRYYLEKLLYGRQSPHGFWKTTQIGFYNQDVAEMVNMIRELHEGFTAAPLNIIWLTRDPLEVVKSFQTTKGPGQKDAIANPEILNGMLTQQHEQFRACFKLGDIKLTYNQLCEDPKKVLLKLRPRLYPKDEIIEPIMKVKLR